MAPGAFFLARQKAPPLNTRKWKNHAPLPHMFLDWLPCSESDMAHAGLMEGGSAA
jgi:hypothetical protein